MKRGEEGDNIKEEEYVTKGHKRGGKDEGRSWMAQNTDMN